MAHDPSLAYADFFAAAGGGDGGAVAAATTLVPELDAGDEDHHLYAAVPHHAQHGAEMFGVRGLVPDAAMAAHGSKQALGLGHVVDASSSPVGGGGHHFALGDHLQHQHHHLQAPPPPFTSLSLHGPADAGPPSLAAALHHHHHGQLGAGAAHGWQQHHHQQGAWHLRGSRFMRPTQLLLQEFCSLPVEATTGSPGPAADASNKPPTTKPAAANEDGAGDSASSAPSTRIQAMDAAELQRLKAKLYAMLEEVDRRYRRYREQMRAVAGSFEAVAGERAAAAYTRLASRTISRHFRRLRDGVGAQMQAVRAALGEKDAAGGVPAAKGETTPRLRVLDQCLRQHRAYQAGALESQPWRPQRGLPERAVSILRAWLFEHFLHPYPSDVDKHILARQTGLSRSQVSNWFINARVRLWKPMVEEMYAEEMKDPTQEGGDASGGANNNPSGGGYGGSELGHPHAGGEDGERKPTHAQLMVHHHDAGSLASVVSIGSSSSRAQAQPPPQSIDFGAAMGGGGHLDFGTYGSGDDLGHAAAGGYGFGGLGASVSLTLGLQQHGRDDPHGGVNIAFAGAAAAPPTGAAHEFLFVPGGAEQQHAMVAGGGGNHGQFGDGIESAGGDAVGASHYHRPGGGLGGATGFQLLRDLAG